MNYALGELEAELIGEAAPELEWELGEAALEGQGEWEGELESPVVRLFTMQRGRSGRRSALRPHSAHLGSSAQGHRSGRPPSRGDCNLGRERAGKVAAKHAYR